MKRFKTTLKVIIASAFIIGITAASAQSIPDNLTGSALKNGVSSHNFVFKAQTLLPETGTAQQLNGGNYTLAISNNILVMDMPYFVKASAASIDASQGGLQFKSVNFTYTEAKVKKGWAIVIEPKDVGGDNLQMVLTVYNDGMASLQISSETRQSVQLDGVIEAQK